MLNPGAWYEDGTFYLLYRAAGEPPAYKICLGLATSADGFNFTRSDANPVLFPLEGTYDGGCIEDARIVKLDGEFLVTYACRPYPPGPYWETGAIWPVPPDAPAEFAGNLTISALAKSKDLINFGARRQTGRR